MGYPKLLRAALLLALTASPALAWSHDLGVRGQTWPITERDIRELMLESAARADWDKANRDLATSAATYFDHFPKRAMPPPSRTNTRWVDPSITIDSDIRIPEKQANGEYAWVVLYPAGTRVNPLAYTVPTTAMLFFDGGDKDQVALMKQAVARYPTTVTPVDATGGNVKSMSESVGRPVFHADEQLLQRFGVTRTPTLLYPGTGGHTLHLGVTEMAPPYKFTELEATIRHMLPAPAKAPPASPTTPGAPRK